MNILADSFNDVNNNFLNFSLSFNNMNLQAFQTNLQNLFSKYDDDFFASQKRKNNFISKGFVSRSFITKFGPVTIKRRKYRNKFNKNIYFYIEQSLSFDKYQRLFPNFKLLLLFERMFTSAAGLSIKYDISRQTVYNLINNFQIPQSEVKKYKYDNDISTVYLEIDEDHTKCRNKKSTFMHLVVIHAGKEKVCNNRNKLIDKYILPFPADYDLDIVAFHISCYLSLRYSIENKKIIVNSDGGKWIKSLIQKIREYNFNITQVYDKYHLTQYLRPFSKEDRIKIRELIESRKREQIKEEYSNLTSKSQIKAIKAILNLFEIMNNIYTTPDYIGSHTEVSVSHCCSNYLSSRPKAYSRKNLKNIAMYLMFFENNKDYREIERRYRNKKVSNLEEVIILKRKRKIERKGEKQTNIPILKQNNSFIRESLKEISHTTII